MRVIIINGPNLNLLGKREKSIYGDISFEAYFERLKEEFSAIELEYYQSNVEGELINKLHEVGFDHDGIILNREPRGKVSPPPILRGIQLIRQTHDYSP